MKETISYLDRRLRAGIDGAAALLLAAVTILGIGQVIARYGFNSSLVWSEEAIRLLYVWLVLMAAATAPHMRISLLSDKLSGGWARLLGLFRVTVCVALLILLINGALTLNASFGSDRYVTLGISKAWYWTGAIVGALLWMGTIMSDFLAAPGSRED